MPIYSYKCDVCGPFEQLRPMSDWDRTRVSCPACGRASVRMAELTTMKPDANWFYGETVPGHGYLNSAARIARAKKSAGIGVLSGRADVEAMRKEAAANRADIARKAKERGRRYFANVIAGSGLVNSFGEIRPEAFQKISDDPIKRGDDPRVS